MESVFAEQAKKKQSEAGGSLPQKSAKPAIDTREEIAKIAGVSHNTISKIKTIETEAPEPVKANQIGKGGLFSENF